MSETKPQILSAASETLFLTLCLRAMESLRLDALIKDEKAEALVKKINHLFLPFGKDTGEKEWQQVTSFHLPWRFFLITGAFLPAHFSAL